MLKIQMSNTSLIPTRHITLKNVIKVALKHASSGCKNILGIKEIHNLQYISQYILSMISSIHYMLYLMISIVWILVLPIDLILVTINQGC